MSYVFDGHNDVLLHLWSEHQENAVELFLNGTTSGQLDLPRMQQGKFSGGLFAMYVPSPDWTNRQTLPQTPSLKDAQSITLSMLATILRIEQASQGKVKICRNVKEIKQSMANGVLAVVLHIEGAEAIAADFDMLEILYSIGVRSIGPLWSRNNIFGHGVPFRFPSSPNIGDGLTDLGCQLVKLCNQKRIMVDLAHLDAKGFWQVAEISDAPLVASHSNAHALCAQSRNLTDRQLDAIKERQGLVGVNFGIGFLRADGQLDPTTTLDEIIRHIDYLIERMGENCVSFGSDFDGTTMPEALRDVTRLPLLMKALHQHGYDQSLLNKICHQNWIDVLERTWGK